jgi:hypothetical protein
MPLAQLCQRTGNIVPRAWHNVWKPFEKNKGGFCEEAAFTL